MTTSDAPGGPTRTWSTPADVVGVLQRRWARGDLLDAVSSGRSAVPQQVPLRRPTPRQVGDRWTDVQAWVHAWERADPGLRVEQAPVGGRLVGSNQVPARAWVDDEAHLWRLLGVTADIAAFRRVLAGTDDRAPHLSTWVRDHPRDVIRAAPVWDRALGVVGWVCDHGGPRTYLRHIDVAGVDTKFVQANQALLAALLDVALPPDRIDHARPRAEFAARYGLATKPAYIRLRRLDGRPLLDDWPTTAGGPAEVTLRAVDLARASVSAGTVVVVENEITYLSLPAVPDTVAVFGCGWAAARLGAVPWLADRDVIYWGDLDTHGFAILDGLRAVVPGARSLLMDRDTLERHRDHWGSEPTPFTGHLTRLYDTERALYRDLVEGHYGPAVRLEQERIRFGHAAAGLLTTVRG